MNLYTVHNEGNVTITSSINDAARINILNDVPIIPAEVHNNSSS